MSQVTIRGLSPDVEQKIRQMARDRRQSINHIITEIIRQNFEQGKRNPRAATIKQLAGGWSEQEASDFLASIESCEQIDEEMWR